MTPRHTDDGLSRRDFLRVVGLTAGSLLISGSEAKGAGLTRRSGTAAKVALAQAATYDRAVIRERVFGQIEALGGLADVVHPGDKVGIKVNLTGGMWWQSQIGVPLVDSMITHPEVVRALAEAVLDAGASEVVIVEGVWDEASYEAAGFAAIAADLGLTLIDLNRPPRGESFISRTVTGGGLVYEEFPLHPILSEIDVFMSVAKMKCHKLAGVTLSMKNLVGITPLRLYQPTGGSNRAMLHGEGDAYRVRLPSVIVDLVRACPIHFALIDGVRTSEGGEGPWIDGWNPVEPGILVAGKNPVATDAVATAAMGFDPSTAGFAAAPFLDCLNHLQLAHELGLGPYLLDQIEIAGARLDDVRFEFRPCDTARD